MALLIFKVRGVYVVAVLVWLKPTYMGAPRAAAHAAHLFFVGLWFVVLWFVASSGLSRPLVCRVLWVVGTHHKEKTSFPWLFFSCWSKNELDVGEPDGGAGRRQAPR
jgi:hypothetical protein